MMECRPSTTDTSYDWKWSGWLATRSQWTFFNFGVESDPQGIQVFCNLLVLIPEMLMLLPTVSSKQKKREIPQPVQLSALLGPMPRVRMRMICEEILGCTADTAHMTITTASARFVKLVSSAMGALNCDCMAKDRCYWSNGWNFCDPSKNDAKRRCHKRSFWMDIGTVLASGLWSLFIDTGPNTTIHMARWVDISSVIAV